MTNEKNGLEITFESDIKDGLFTLDGIEVETKIIPMIRFNK